MVEERNKMVDAAPLWLLVANEAQQVILTVSTQLQDAAKRFFHWWTSARNTIRTNPMPAKQSRTGQELKEL